MDKEIRGIQVYLQNVKSYEASNTLKRFNKIEKWDGEDLEEILKYVCKLKCLKVLRLMLSKGLDPNFCVYKQSLISFGILKLNVEMINLICEFGEVFHVKDGSGKTGLDYFVLISNTVKRRSPIYSQKLLIKILKHPKTLENSERKGLAALNSLIEYPFNFGHILLKRGLDTSEVLLPFFTSDTKWIIVKEDIPFVKLLIENSQLLKINCEFKQNVIEAVMNKTKDRIETEFETEDETEIDEDINVYSFILSLLRN